MARYLIISNKTGQLGNRLVLWAHMLGAGFERGWTVLNPSFDEYAPDFEGSTGAWLVAGARHQLPPPQAARRGLYWGNRVGYKLAYVLHRVPGSPIGWVKAANTCHFDLRGMLDRAEASNWRMVFTQNYHFREHSWVATHAQRIRELLVPIAQHRAEAETTLAAARKGAEVIIGVHVRHGDYREHRGGEFYYEAPVYRRLMASVAELHAGRRVRFVVFSNGSVSPADFPGLDVRPGPGGVVSDLHALSLCDAVMGPPSSFSAWAAFHGNRPYWMIEKPLPAAPGCFIVQPSPDPKY